MKNIELTDRGKILIAVILVVILLVIPSVILTIRSFNDSPQPIVDNTLPPAENSSKLGDVTIIDDNELSNINNGINGADTANSNETQSNQIGSGNNFGGSRGDEVTKPGPIGLNITAGTMAFVFFPDEQDALDDETFEMLNDFLSSPKNTGRAQIQVEMPNISEDHTTKLMIAVGQAFAQYEVAMDDIIYVKSRKEVTTNHFEVYLSYYTYSSSSIK